MSVSKCPIVGIGASAGGLKALQDLFGAMPEDTGAAFVVIQHLDPKHESLTAEILTRSTRMPTVQVSDGMQVEPNHIYVIPPNAYLTLSQYQLKLSEPILLHGLRMPIDTFFGSLAEQHEESAIAVIVSGTGSDGALGLRAIKGSGGLVMAQSPETAQYDGMPRSAIATGLVDVSCAVEEMSKHLLGYLRNPYVVEQTSGDGFDIMAAQNSNHLRSILAILRTRTGHDFKAYKQGTLGRRIARRMGLHHIESMAEYLTLLRNQENEASLLFQDLLIGVTAFFRDTEAFAALEKDVIAPLVKAKHPDEPIRVWIPGCASGEEAYSIAMLLIEHLEKAHKHCPVQVFASDIDESALKVGRSGVYPVNIAANISAQRLQRFFNKESHNYRISESLRATVTFAGQNLISDPPFSNLDLISCRNLLIYLSADVQRKVIGLFHFALRPDGCLFLGHSETSTQHEGLFDPLSKKWRIYRRSGVTRTPNVDFPVGSRTSLSAAQSTPPKSYGSDQSRLSELIQQHLLLEFAPAAVLIDRKHQVLQFSGPTSRYLEQPAGAPSQDFLNLVRHGLRTKLRIALRRVADEKQRLVIDDLQITREGEKVRVKASLKPIKIPKLPDTLVLVTFEDVCEEPAQQPGKRFSSASADANLVQQMEDELHLTREDLQSHIEELESSNEELQAANEEVMSVNEELQSSNEELESSKEELQSMNEELITVNNQYKDKVGELAHSNDDLANLLSSKDIATLFVDAAGNIKHFTEAAKPLLNLISADIGRPLRDIRPKFGDSALMGDMHKVLHKLLPVEREIIIDSGDYYLQRILPYRTSDNRIDGVVINFIDITAHKEAEEQTRRLAAVVRDSNDAVTLTDINGNITAWNRGAQKMYGWSEREALAMRIHDLVPPLLHKDTSELLQRIARGDDVLSIDTCRVTKDKREIDVWLTLTPLRDQLGDIIAVASTERDVTQRNRLQSELRASEANFRALVESAPDALVIINANGSVEVTNTQAERLFGYGKNELLGISIDELIVEQLPDQHKTQRFGFFTNPTNRTMGDDRELSACTRDGRMIPVEVSLCPIETDRGKVVSAAIRDISARKKIDRALHAAKLAADSAMTAKSRFLSTASHDLRQPLQSLKLLNKALRKSIDEPKILKMLGMQNESLSGMTQLLNSLLDISKLESGTVDVDISDQFIEPILQRIHAEFKTTAKNKGLELRFNVANDVVCSDAGLLAQLIQNLLANAIRYTKTGFVELSCAKEKNHLLIAVRDSGIGISNEQLALIFDEFHQVNRDPQLRHGGLGLGLSIVQRIATLLGTEVKVASRVGFGSSFSFLLPEGQSENAKATQLTATQLKALRAPTVLANSLILLVDDDPDVLEASQILLSMEQGFEIITAASPPAAYAILGETVPDLIITDFHFNHEDSGIDIIRTIRARGHRMIPALLVSGDTSPAMDKYVNNDNSIFLMTKPMDADDLISTARLLLSQGASG